MNQISEITRRDIILLFKFGYDNPNSWLDETERIIYYYNGVITDIEFLNRLYTLEEIPSSEQRFGSVADEIWQHTVNNPNDWPPYWIFEDERFPIKYGSDKDLLNFLCEVFHPAVRNENGYWKGYLTRINQLLKADCYELYESEKISNRYTYSWRHISEEESISSVFIPFSIRNKKFIENKTLIVPGISKKVRGDLINIFNKYDIIEYRTSDTNYNYHINSKGAVLEDISLFYMPKAFDAKRKYSETNDFDLFINNNFPYCVIDAIELFAKLSIDSGFSDDINILFRNNSLAYEIMGGKIELLKREIKIDVYIKEEGLKDLVDHSIFLFNKKGEGNKQLAVEKVWDAFERLKTYYTEYDKSKSAERIVYDMSNGNESFITLFNEEFRKLTDIGNGFRIRHHETNKIDIIDINYYDYFFQRCISLIELALKYLK